MPTTLRWLFWSTLIPLVLSSSSSQAPSGDVTISSIKDACREHSYKTHLISEDPLVIYIESFVTPEEASQLTDLSESKFKPSPLWSDDGKVSFNPNYRSSLTASLDRQSLIQCLETRARSFPFYSTPNALIKPLVVQRYGPSNQYRDHYDWFSNSLTLDGNIDSTFFVYIQANCTGGGTNFPRLKALEDEKWCDWVDCDQELGAGVTFRPITGNAIFWRNLDETGEGLKSTLHAGLPVTEGMKTGLNIWTWVTYNKGKSEL
ncbi:hypothetical protein N431DRAFT_506800 [Stipitochalara longipes BDJ]|nr:hypothetical protein N431DRAFT_506800 [Stipitochalara longipes BDJ]